MARLANLYRVELHHPDYDGKFYDLWAQSEDMVREIAMINAPAGAYIERIVPLKSNAERPPQNEDEDVVKW